MANGGPNTNTAHVSILMNPAPHLNTHYTVFGEVVAGLDVADAINALARPPGSGSERPVKRVVIADAGQLNAGVTVPYTDS